MQIQILMPSDNGQYYPNYDELIKNARDEDERKYLMEVRDRYKKWKSTGFDGGGFAFGIIYTQRMECGHYEMFQHPIFRDYGKEPTEDDVIKSIEDVLHTIKINKRDHRKCTRCICGWNEIIKEEN